ncbi:MAG: hypothetical protein COU85_01705 [Candidatus Portnoybacteria bacterium CG10_big_fil_rev_8_21_14_0_10_44_7]|uniref:O-antigen ligase-related domain-containing protein n=1 Tax=Candidatus Portnoybacteria bacterium CG10_big_fil_rev_8_21_14_0_10_44_7 TaxID=1974816 RepID=A0A2M8KIR4_9BACT|nr:MAG: hypothetical protein COU85_01705 [Candidatus Portnoybacteria bacterium CG10_big_fil_rev_8_21_14_0_10_44_7]
MFYQLTTPFELGLLAFGLAAFAGLSFWRPKWALVSVLFLLPVYLLKFKIGLISLTALDGLLFLAGAGWWQKNIKIGRIKFLTKKNYWFLYGFLLAAFLACLSAADFWRALGLFKSVIFLPLFLGLALVPAKKLNKSHLLYPVFLSGLLVAAVAMVYLLSGRVSYDGRLAAFWQSPNQLAIFLGLAFLAGAALIFKPKPCNKKTKIQLALGCFGLLAVVALTFSLGVWVALSGAILGSWLFLLAKKRRLFLGLFFGFYLLFWGQLLFGGSFGTKVFGPSFVARLAIWRAAGKIISQHWLAGIGLGNFQAYYLAAQRFFPPYPQWAVPHAHNFWLDGMVFFGFLGFILLLGFLVWQLWLKSKKQPPFLFFWLYLFFFLVLGLVDEPVWRNDLAVIFWLAWLIF